MLIIRKEQIDLMARELFVVPGVDYLRRHFAKRVNDHSVADLERFVRASVDRARAYEIDSPTGWCRFLTLLVALGDDFDARPDFAWVVEIIRDRSLGAGDERALAATHAVIQHLIAEVDRAEHDTPAER
jgi:hypothetical protein